ncbi:MAG: hypothetical protein EOP09_06390 [Proteobacteria bacterium]|nr:MAG: hypothetical protein EOP09_06390 [Pseudomonadota bacterium]
MLEIVKATSFCDKITWNGEVQAIIVRSSKTASGYNFVSDNEDSLQLGVNYYPAGTKVKPHRHPPLSRQLTSTAEFLHIDDGSCDLKLFTDDFEFYYETVLNSGDSVLCLRGGHSLNVLDATRIIEVKQGPYYGAAKDKIVFDDGVSK